MLMACPSGTGYRGDYIVVTGGECLADKYKVAVNNEPFAMNGRWDHSITLSMSDGGFLSND